MFQGPRLKSTPVDGPPSLRIMPPFILRIGCLQWHFFVSWKIRQRSFVLLRGIVSQHVIHFNIFQLLLHQTTSHAWILSKLVTKYFQSLVLEYSINTSNQIRLFGRDKKIYRQIMSTIAFSVLQNRFVYVRILRRNFIRMYFLVVRFFEVDDIGEK